MIYLIEGKRTKGNSLGEILTDNGFDVKIFDDIAKAERDTVTANSDPDILIINVISTRTSGTRISKRASETIRAPIILVSAKAKKSELPYVNDVLRVPFTARKLLNRIAKYIEDSASEYICKGPVKLHKKKHQVCANQKVTGLTPKAYKLIRYLIDNAGEVARREQLIRHVWDNNYFGDTRTLDTHISWIRKAIEIDPRQPKLIITMRGVGYRLDLPPD